MATNQTIFTNEEYIKVRRDTPGLSSRIHLDNCGSSLMPRPVVDIMSSYLESEIRLGGYVAQEQQSKKLAAVYQSLATLFGGAPADYALTSGAVDAWSKAFYSIPLTSADNIVTVYNEYCSNYVACLQRAKREGVEIRIARSAKDGSLDLDHLSELVDENTKIVSITHVASSSGQVVDLTAIKPIVKKYGAYYLLDACQSVGQLPVNFVEIGCDIATATSRKFLRGPRGIGFLYINKHSRQRLEPAMLTNQSAAWTGDGEYKLVDDASMFEMWERSCLNQLGFGAALEYLRAIGLEKATAQTQYVAHGLRSAVYSLKGVEATCQEDASAAIITFNKNGWSALDVRTELEKLGIAVQVSTVFHTRLDLGARGIDSAVRVSPHYYNDQSEFDRFLNAVDEL